jgi:hypothetical protein
MEHQPAEGAVGLLRLLTGMRDGSRGARSSGGMLLVMMGLAGLLTPKPAKRAEIKHRKIARADHAARPKVSGRRH